MPKRLRNILIIIGNTLFLLILLEFSIHLLAPQVDTKQMLQGDSMAIEDEDLGHRNRPGAELIHTTPEFEAHYSIDTLGLRAGYPTTLDSTARKVLLVGDSFTFGYGVDDSHTWASVLEQSWQDQECNVDVLNAGVPGYDTRLELLALADLIEQHQPDLLLLGFLPNDVFTNRLPTQSSAADPTIAIGQRRSWPKMHLLSWLIQQLMASDVLYTRLYKLTPRYPYFQEPPTTEVRHRQTVTDTLLHRVYRKAKEQSITLAVVSIPQLFQVLSDEETSSMDQLFRTSAQNDDVQWITTLDTLRHQYRTQKQELYYRFDGHLNADGNRVVGTFLANHLPCPGG